MKTLSIASQYDRLPEAASGQRALKSTETFTPACEGIFDFMKRSKVEKEVQADPTRISTANKSVDQMLLTIKHFIENPDAYTFHGEKVTVKTTIFGGATVSGSISSLISELEKFTKSFPGEMSKLSQQDKAEFKPRNKHCDNLEAEFNKVRSNGADVGEEFVRKHIYPIASQFIPTGATLVAEGKLKITPCHVPLFKTELVSFDWGKDGRIEELGSRYEGTETVIPALSPTDGERLLKLLWSLAGKTKVSVPAGSSGLTYLKMEEAEQYIDDDVGFYYDKGMVRSCTTDDAACLVTQVWGDGVGSSAGDLMDMFNDHIYAVMRTWTMVALGSLKRNPNVALENYYEFTPACEGFVDVIKAGFEKLTGTGDKREKHKLGKDKYGNSEFNPKQRGKKLHEIVSEALADTYNNPKWVEKYVDNTSSMYEHAEMGYLYAGKRLVKLEDLVGELKKVRGFLDDLRRREQPFIDVRLDVYKKVETISKIGGSEQRVKLAIELYDRNKEKLESFIGSRIPTSIAKYEAVGCQGPLFIHNPPTYNYYYPSKGKSFEYPIPSKENYKVYIETLNALLKESEEFDQFLASDRGFSVPYFEDLPSFIWDDMEGTDHDDYYDKYLSNVGSTQSREELVDYYYSYRNILTDVTIAVYHLLFNAQKLNPANEGLVDFFKEMFSSEKTDINKIVKGTKESEAEVAALIQKTYNNPSWVAKVPEAAVPLKGAEFGYLFFSGKQLDSNGVLAKSQELFKVADTGVSRLVKNAEVRWNIIQSLKEYDDDYSYKHRVDDKEDMIEKVFGEFTKFYKPMPVIGSQKPWFTPTDYSYLDLSIEPYRQPVTSITKADVIKLRTQVPAVTKELLRMISSLTESACSGHSPGNEERMLADDEEVFFEAKELEHDRGSMITHALFDGEGGDTEGAGTAPAVALRTAFLLSHVLKAYLTWAFKRA